MVVYLERGADLHMAQLMPLPLTVPCFSKIQIGFTFLVPAHPDSPGKGAVKRVCVCVVKVYFVFLCFCVSLDHFDFVLLVLLGSLFSVPSQEIGWEERLRSDLFCVEWDVKPCSIHPRGWLISGGMTLI